MADSTTPESAPLSPSGQALHAFVARVWTLTDALTAHAAACHTLARELTTAVSQTLSDAALTRRLHEEETRLADLRQRTTEARVELATLEETVAQQRDELARLEAATRATRDQLRTLQTQPALG